MGVYYEILPRSKAEKTGENQAADSEYPVTCPQYSPMTSQVQVHSLITILTWLCINEITQILLKTHKII